MAQKPNREQYLIGYIEINWYYSITCSGLDSNLLHFKLVITNQRNKKNPRNIRYIMESKWQFVKIVFKSFLF